MMHRPRGLPLRCLALLLGQALLPAIGSAVAASVAVEPVGADVAATVATAVPRLMLAKLWQPNRDPAAFLVSEKFDGVRALWDGQHLRFRSGLPIAAPDWFIAGLPKVALDGELWLGRGQFDALSATVRRAVPVDAEWHAVRYMVFDLPGAPEPFGERLQHLTAVVRAAGQSWLQVVAQQRVASAPALQVQLKRLVRDGGEGLVLHRANALWSPGRSDALLKYKLVPDEDALVVAHLPGKGRNKGRLGALLMEMPDGQRFALGTGFTDAQRAEPPPVGSVVTYRYRDRTPRGLPRFASFFRVREGQ